jgi:DNA-binding Lrp family transcriptional regulator
MLRRDCSAGFVDDRSVTLISEQVRNLLAEHISSVEQLEILLFLREESSSSWTADQINERIRSSLSSVASRLADLEARGFVRRDGAGFRYDPPPDRAAAVDELAVAYAERRFTVIELIFAGPADKTAAFARAFRFRKDDDA